MKVLVLNCGSSSIKFQVIDMTDEEVLIQGIYERVGHENAFLTVKWDEQKDTIEKGIKNHTEGIAVLLDVLVDKKYGALESLDEIEVIGHRVVHGGEGYAESVLIDDHVLEEIEKCIPLAPLHNPANIQGIKAAMENMPGKPNVAVFDTAFHQTMPEVAYIYNIPYEYYEKDGIRKYGFHGTSHRYITDTIGEVTGKGKENIKLISCHIGQGASIAAVDGGKSMDTSMGLTPLAGIPMGTRCGDIDPSIPGFIAEKYNLTLQEVDEILNKKSGSLGVSGVSSDNRDVENAAKEGNKRAQLALDSSAYLTAQQVASYIVTLGGVDVIAFAGGLGENAALARENICRWLEPFGVKLDEQLNDVRGKLRKISTEDSEIEVWIVPTNEELMIARDAKEIVEG